MGGIATTDGRAAFPSAVVRADARDAKEFKAAMAPLKPYADAGRFKTFDGATDLVPGISAVPAYGHTPGHTIYIVESEGQKLAVWGDFVHVAAVQFPQPTATWTEFDSTLAWRQRLKQFADAATKGYDVALAHVAFPGIGRLRAEGSGYVWVPAVYTR